VLLNISRGSDALEMLKINPRHSRSRICLRHHLLSCNFSKHVWTKCLFKRGEWRGRGTWNGKNWGHLFSYSWLLLQVQECKICFHVNVAFVGEWHVITTGIIYIEHCLLMVGHNIDCFMQLDDEQTNLFRFW